MKKYKYLFANGCSFVLGRSTGTIDTGDNNSYVSMEHRFSAILAFNILSIFIIEF